MGLDIISEHKWFIAAICANFRCKR